ncbi:MAG: hypothetical protein AAF560_17790 [Acidobacteriota bacterium]
MKRPAPLAFLLASLLIIPLSAPAHAESSPEAMKWLEKLLSIYEQAPFTVDYTATVNLDAMGQQVSGNMNGSITQGDKTHSRMSLELQMSGIPGMTSGPVTMKVLNVIDGTTIWSEMENPALGGKQVTKVALEQAAALAQSTGGMNPASLDPVAQLRTLTETMDFEVVGKEGGVVTLRGTVTEATRSQLSTLTSAADAAFLFRLDERTGFPKEVRAEGDQPFITMVFNNLKFVDEKDLPAGVFEYTPAEGTPVMDLGAFMAPSSR